MCRLSISILAIALAVSCGSIGPAWSQEDETDQDERMPVQPSAVKLPISASQAIQNKILIPEATLVKTRRLQVPQDISINTFNDCPAEGNAKTSAKEESNKEKNRWEIPDETDIDTTISLQSMLAPGEDEQRFKAGTPVRVRGYFSEVFKSGGSHGESCNCNATDDVNTDTHINMSLTNSAEDIKPENRLIVEVTPRLRYIAGLNGLDWSHANLKNYEGSCLEIEGYLFWDDAHKGESRNTPGSAKEPWRATLWEVHPITSIQEIDCNKLF